MADFLLQAAVDSISKARPELAGWCNDKLIENAKIDRLGALRFVCCSLDSKNQTIVADALGIDAADLAATARVLRAV